MSRRTGRISAWLAEAWIPATIAAYTLVILMVCFR